MKFFVTGANGFLGRYVVAEALRRGHAVTAILRSAAMTSIRRFTNGSWPRRNCRRRRRGITAC